MKRKRWKKSSIGFPGEKQLSTLLKGRTAAPSLKSGPLEVIPLLGSACKTDRYAPPIQSLTWASSPQLSLYNGAAKMGILPMHLAFVEHGLPGQSLGNCRVLGPGERITIEDAASLSPPDANWHLPIRDQLIALPFMLRAAAFAQQDKRSPARLWEPIRQMARTLQIPLSGISTAVRRQWWTQMQDCGDQLSVQAGQTGAIILLNGEVIGLELAPDETFWKDWWPSLCTYTYAPLAMIPAVQKGVFVPQKTLVGSPIGSLKTLRAEKEAIFELQRQKATHTMALLATSPLEYELSQQLLAHKVLNLEAGPFLGQCVFYEDQPAYLSLFRKDRWQYG